MAVIGHAEIVVTAITKNFENQLKKSMGGISKSMSSRAGRNLGDGFADGFARSNANNMFGKLADGIQSLAPQAESARKQFQSLVRTGYTVSAVMGLVAGGISSVAVSIGPLIGSLLRAAPAAATFLSIFTTLTVAMRVARAAFGGIGAAVKAAVAPNQALGKSLKEVREEFQQLQFDAEDAALSEKRAALNLEKAMNNLRRMQDLPPNSAARREAELEVEEAELALRRAKDRTKDLNEEVAKGPEALAKAAGGTDPFAGLNTYQRKFAEYLVSLEPKFERLRTAMSKAFLTPLQEAVEILMKELFPILDRRLPEVAGKVGDAMKGIAIQLSTPANAAKLESILETMQPNILLIGEIFGDILDIILSIVAATDELATEFLTYVRDVTKEWVDELNRATEDGSLVAFFEAAAEEAKKWWVVVQNIFDGFKNLMNLTTGPGSAGEVMLEWFTEASAEFKNMFSEDPDAGKKFFRDAMINAKAVLSAIGDFVLEILKVADNPNIAIAFNTLGEAAPAFGEMLDKIIDAAPSFAELVVTIVEIINALTDGDQISAFFDTLNAAATGFKETLESPFVKKMLEDLGPLAATLSALGVIFDVLKFGAFVALGYVAFMLRGISTQLTLLGGADTAKAGGGFKNLGRMIKGAGIIGLIILVITKIVEFYEKFEDFREIVDNTVANVGDSFSGVFEELGKLFDNLFGGEDGGGLLGVLDPILKFLLEALIPGLGFVLSTIANVVETAISLINTALEAFTPAFESLFEAIGLLLEGDFMGFLRKLLEGIGLFVLGAVQSVINGVIDLLNGGLRFINDWIQSIANGPFGRFLKEKLGIDIAGVRLQEIAKVEWVQDVKRRQQNDAIKASFSQRTRADGTPKLALGATVYPSSGGTMVTVAEAGRPERIEPLDPNGLSKRDMALIQQLSGGGATINVYPSAGMDERELSELVSRRIAFEVRKGSF
jgi:phage-related protein